MPDGTPVHYERHRPEQTTLYRPVQQHAASFTAHIEASTGGELPRFIKAEFDAFLECGPGTAESAPFGATVVKSEHLRPSQACRGST